MAIDNARGYVILFLDDAVAEKRWVEKYKNLTPCPTSAESVEQHIKHIFESGKVVKTYEPFYDEKPPKDTVL